MQSTAASSRRTARSSDERALKKRRTTAWRLASAARTLAGVANPGRAPRATFAGRGAGEPLTGAMSAFAPIALSTPVLTSPIATVPARTRPVPETTTLGAGFAASTTGLAGGVWTGVAVVFCSGASALAAAASPWALVELALSTARPRPPGMGDFFGGAAASDWAGGVWAAGAGRELRRRHRPPSVAAQRTTRRRSRARARERSGRDARPGPSIPLSAGTAQRLSSGAANRRGYHRGTLALPIRAG